MYQMKADTKCYKPNSSFDIYFWNFWEIEFQGKNFPDCFAKDSYIFLESFYKTML